MASRPGAIPSRQDRQAARLRGAGTAKIQNVGFKIQGGPSIKPRTPARTPGRAPARTPASTRRPQLEDMPQSTGPRSDQTSMGPPAPKSNVKHSARGGPASLRKSVSGTSVSQPSDLESTSTIKRGRGRPRKSNTATPGAPREPEVTSTIKRGQGRPRKSTTAPLGSPIELVTAPVIKRGRGRPSMSAQATPVINRQSTPEDDGTPSPKPTKQILNKRKSIAKDTRPTKKPRPSLPQSSPSPSPSPSLEETPSVVSSPSPSPQSKPRKKSRETDGIGTIGVRVHKLPPSAGGTRHLNEIDGTLQVITEILDGTTSRLATRDATQAKILGAFTEEVTIRFIEMTDAWDNHAVLLAAVRRAQKKKNMLRQELVAIRRERGDLAREMESVRRGHEIGEMEMRDVKLQQDFIQDMEDIKARVEIAEEDDQVKNGIEAALIELRPLVAGKSGIAERLASFNRFLERFDNVLTNASG